MTTMSNPITIIKTRLEVVGFNQYSGMLDAARQIKQVEGYRGFFTGLQISLIRDVPFSGLFYPIYSVFRTNLMHVYGAEMSSDEKSQRLKAIAIISSISTFMANVVACTLTHPLDLIRTREFFKFHNKDTN